MPIPTDPQVQLSELASYLTDMLGVLVRLDFPGSSSGNPWLQLCAPNPTPGEEVLVLATIPLYQNVFLKEWRIRGTVSTSIPCQTLAAIAQYMTMYYESDGTP